MGEGILLLAKAKSSKSFFRFCVAESRGNCRIYEMDSVILCFACEILGVWILDSMELWNRWLIGVGKREWILLFAKAKSSKSFFIGIRV